MEYYKQLQTEEWKSKREEILKRDNNCCHNCSNEIFIKSDFGETAIFDCFLNDFKIYVTQITHTDILIKKDRGIKDKKIFVYFNGKGISEFENFKAIRTKLPTDIEKPPSKSNKEIRMETIKHVYNEYLKESSDRNALIKKVVDSMSIWFFFDDKPEINYNVTEKELEELIIDDFKPKSLKKRSNVKEENHTWLAVKDLHIHHKYYQVDKFAWEYPNDALITLCWDCHEKLHKNTEIEIRDINNNLIRRRTVCSRCYGAGYFPEYNHVQNGVCFKCGGSRFEN